MSRSRGKTNLALTAIALLGLVTTAGAFTEPKTGSLTGTVIESFCFCSGELGFCGQGERGAAGVTVQLGDELSAVTATDGSYVFPEAPPGTYTVGVFVDGFGMARARVKIQPGRTSAADLRTLFAVPGQMIVTFVPGTTREEIDALNEPYGVTVLRVLSGASGTFLLQIPPGSYLQDLVDAYRRDPIVRFAGPNSIACLTR
jgi:hypothetical protein